MSALKQIKRVLLILTLVYTTLGSEDRIAQQGMKFHIKMYENSERLDKSYGSETTPYPYFTKFINHLLERGECYAVLYFKRNVNKERRAIVNRIIRDYSLENSSDSTSCFYIER